MDIETYAKNLSAFYSDDIWIYKPAPVKDEVYGSVDSGFLKSGPFKANVQPYSGDLAFRDCGEKIECKKRVFLSPDVAVSEGWGVSFSDSDQPELIVKWAPLYKTHQMILAGTR